jgi:hypothetical protein
VFIQSRHLFPNSESNTKFNGKTKTNFFNKREETSVRAKAQPLAKNLVELYRVFSKTPSQQPTTYHYISRKPPHRIINHDDHYVTVHTSEATLPKKNLFRIGFTPSN